MNECRADLKFRIRNGMFDQARTAASDMLTNNTSGIAPEYFETESWVSRI